MAKLSIPAAAAQLGVSVDTVRRRIRKGELEATKDSSGVLHVEIDDEPFGEREYRPEYGVSTVLVQELRDQVAYLKGELEKRDYAEGELRRLLGNEQLAMQRLLPAPASAPAAPAERPQRWWRFWAKAAPA